MVWSTLFSKKYAFFIHVPIYAKLAVENDIIWVSGSVEFCANNWPSNDENIQ